MQVQSTWRREGLSTSRTNEGFLARVSSHVALKVLHEQEGFGAFRTTVQLFPAVMHSLVNVQGTG